MSVARIHETKKSRKVWTCGKCGEEIPKGSPVLHFAVGFRGYNQSRHADRPGCYPKPSERESSAVATVLAAQEEFDVSELESVEDIEEAVRVVAEACNEVAEEYSSNEMFDINEDLQERASTLEAAASELESWTPSADEPDEDADDEERESWLETIRDEATSAVNDVELP